MARPRFTIGLVVVLALVVGVILTIRHIDSRAAYVPTMPASQAAAAPSTAAPAATTPQPSPTATAAYNIREDLQGRGYTVVSSSGGKEVWKPRQPPYSPTVTLGPGTLLTVVLADGTTCRTRDKTDLETFVSNTITNDSNKATDGLSTSPQPGAMYYEGSTVYTTCWIAH